jgi:DNA uptake protein ComE-like DNA-binding protein
MKNAIGTFKQIVSPESATVFLLSTLLLGVLLITTGCQSHPTDQQIQQQAAQTTQQVKQDAEHAARDARVAAAKAEDKIDAVAAGVKQGMRGGASASTVDLNSATRDQLVSLPGVTPGRARKIIAGRPYATPSDLVSRNILPQSEFDKISNRVTAQ